MDPILAALTTLLSALGDVLKAVFELLIKKNEANKEKLKARLEKLEQAYRNFMYTINKVRTDLQEEEIDKIIKDLDSYKSELDSSYLNVQIELEQLIQEFQHFHGLKIYSEIRALLRTTRDMEKLWKEFRKAVHEKDIYRSNAILDQLCTRMEKRYNTVKELANKVLVD